MADETPTAAPVAAPAVEAAAPVAAVETPVVETPAPAAPVVETSAPAVEPAAPAPEVKTETAAEPAKPLLGPEAEAPKPDVVAEAPKAEPAPAPVYEFKLPEGSNADNPSFKSFTSRLGEFQNLSKSDQAVTQKFGQDLIDMHVADVKQVVEQQQKASWDWFNNRNKEWLESAKNDPQIGGDKFDATLSSASQAISLYGGSKSQQIETAKLLQETGLENSPIMLRFLSNITRIAAKEGTPVSGSSAPSKQTFSPANALYGGDKKTA